MNMVVEMDMLKHTWYDDEGTKEHRSSGYRDTHTHRQYSGEPTHGYYDTRFYNK